MQAIRPELSDGEKASWKQWTDDNISQPTSKSWCGSLVHPEKGRRQRTGPAFKIPWTWNSTEL